MKREIAVVGMVICIVGGFFAGWLIPPLFTVERGTTLLDQIVNVRKEIIIGTSSDWPPFEIYNTTTEQYEGFDIDLCNLVADYLNVTIEWSDMDFNALIGACKAGTIDMIAAAMFIETDRIIELSPSVPYLRTNMVVIALKNSTAVVDSYSDLANYTVGVQTGTAEQYELDDADITYDESARADIIIQKLANEAIDLAFVDEPVFTVWSKIYDLKIIYTVPAPPCALWCRWEEPELLEAINIVIINAYSDGTLDELVDKWFT